MHGKGGNIMRVVEKTDPLPRLQSGNYHGFGDDANMAYVLDGS